MELTQLQAPSSNIMPRVNDAMMNALGVLQERYDGDGYMRINGSESHCGTGLDLAQREARRRVLAREQR